MSLASISSRLLLHDVNNWNLQKSFGSYDHVIRDISWSDDGKYLLQVNPKGIVEVLCLSDEGIRSLQQVPHRDTWCASFHRDSHHNIAIGTKAGTVVIWDTKNKSITKTFPTSAQHSCVNFISYNVKNSNVAAAMQNGETVIYSLVSNVPVLYVKLAASRSISAMKFHHEARALLGLATDEGHIVLRDIATNKDKAFFEHSHASPVSDFTFSKVNKDVMLSCGYDKFMLIHDMRLKDTVSNQCTTCPLTSIDINLENQVALGTRNGKILVYDLRNITRPLMTLNEHNGEVRKVAFHPCSDLGRPIKFSLKDDNEFHTSGVTVQSPTRSNRSDMFIVNDSLRNNFDSTEPSEHGDSKADSFLAVMGLDKSNMEEENKSYDNVTEANNCKNTFFTNNASEISINKVSTPITGGKAIDNFIFQSPVIPTVNGSIVLTNNNIVSSNLGTNNCVVNTPSKMNVDNVNTEELKDFIKATLYDVATDNKHYFCSTMMALTKQNFNLKKDLANVNNQMEKLAQNQNEIMEMNRKLALEIDKLKISLQYT